MSQLTPKHGDNVPEGAVKITKEEALTMQLDLINNWEPKSDVYVSSYFFCGANYKRHKELPKSGNSP